MALRALTLAASGAASSGLSESMKTALNTAFQQIVTDVQDLIGTALPYALGVVGTVMAIVIGIGVFSKITAKA